MGKDLAYFMRESAKREEIITVPAPTGILDEAGKPVKLEIKALSQKTIQDITGKYKTKKIVFDRNKQPYVIGGEVVYQVEADHARAARHLIVEALQYPDLKDPELMSFFDCHDITDMPMLVFSKNGEYSYVSRMVFRSIGLYDDNKEEKDIDDAKN